MSDSSVSAPHDRMANAIRALAMDAVQAAKSGHPGMPMGMADAATVLFTQFLKFDPQRPDWPDRDRFLLSAGHGSMLLYALLHLTGYPDMTMAELRNFRQLHSRTAGHPEYGAAPGIETTTGPLGQGLANAVGMALAERMMNARFGDDLVDHRTWAVAGDGCLMEGISQEAITLAGHLELGRLIVLFDDNEISIDGPTGLATSDDQARRFEACGWHVQTVDGHDPAALAAAMQAACDDGRPSMIACRTVIGYGAPTKAGTAATHGAPLGEDEIAGARERLDWRHPPFELPAGVTAAWRKAGARGAADADAWEARLAAAEPDIRAQFEQVMDGTLPAGLGDAVNALKMQFAADAPKMATRQASGKVLDRLTETVPELAGGSADLTGSNNTRAAGHTDIAAGDFSGGYIRYGVREHGMAAAMNGMALHGGLIPYGGTFLVFTDYARPAIRLSALMEQRVIYVMTHDSIGLGEDGPTHQAVEHGPSLRLVPNLSVWRPCDTVEAAAAWRHAVEREDGPVCLLLSRQGVPHQARTPAQIDAISRGGYVLVPEAPGRPPEAVIVATGSEVGLAVDVAAALSDEGHGVRVVSMPSTDVFDAQDATYRSQVLPPDGLRVAVEASHPDAWRKYVGLEGLCIGVATFGESAPAADVYRHFGLTAEEVTAAVRARLEGGDPPEAGSGPA